MLTLIALLPIGLRSERTSFKESAAINLIHAVATDLANTPRTNGTNNIYSYRFGLPLPSNYTVTTLATNTVYVNDSERAVATATAGTFGIMCLYNPPVTTGITAPLGVEVQVYWPANATPANAQGSVESYLTFPQNLP